VNGEQTVVRRFAVKTQDVYSVRDFFRHTNPSNPLRLHYALLIGMFQAICCDEKMIIAIEQFNSNDHFNGGLE
jgi:hypothetical protein